MWEIILGIGIIFLLMEMFFPSMFFLNFAFAAFICALISYFYQNIVVLIVLFCLISFISIFTIRPLFIKNKTKKEEKTGMEEKYIGKTAKVIEPIDKTKGAISIYDERWQARNVDDFVIEVGENIKITGYESLIMKVKKID